MKKTAVGLALVGALLVGSAAMAQSDSPMSTNSSGSITDSSNHHRPGQLSIMAYLPWYYGFGFGVSVGYAIPVLPNGFIPSINDSFDIEPGASISYASYGYGYGFGTSYSFVNLNPYVQANWRFHFSERFAAYAHVGAGVNIPIGYNGLNYGGYFYFDIGPGITYQIGDRIALRAEAGTGGLRAGIAILF